MLEHLIAFKSSRLTQDNAGRETALEKRVIKLCQ